MSLNQELLAEVRKLRQDYEAANSLGIYKFDEYGTLPWANPRLPGQPSTILEPAQSVTILSDETSIADFGFLIIVADNPFLRVTLKMGSSASSQSTFNLVWDIYDLWLKGFVNSNDYTPYLTRYDTGANYYVMMFNPNPPKRHDKITLNVENLETNYALGQANTLAKIYDLQVARTIFQH